MSAPLFSVIIPAFNRLSFLPECLASVDAQSFRDFELIVVDDGSTDGTSDYLASEAPGAHLVRQANAGPGAARNKGASLACGRYLVFLDSDDLWTPWALETYARALDTHGHCSMLFGNFNEFEGLVEAVTASKEAFSLDCQRCYLDAAGRGYFGGAGIMVIERIEFLKAGGFHEMRINAEDHDLALRLGEIPGFGQILSPVTVLRRLHQGNVSGSLNKSLAGIRHLVQAERYGKYPGGEKRAAQRRAFIGLHSRPVILSALKSGYLREAWKLYFETITWNLYERRLKFFLWFWVSFFICAAKKI